MVRGLDLFRESFASYKDRYILIGGAASTIVMEEAGLEFRATKDLDIVLCIEAFDAAFASTAMISFGSMACLTLPAPWRHLPSSGKTSVASFHS
jgi:hypothetical protein